MELVFFKQLLLLFCLILTSLTYSLTLNEKTQKSLFHLLKTRLSDKPKTKSQSQQNKPIVNDLPSNNQVNTRANLTDNSAETGYENSSVGNFTGWLSISSELFKNPTRYPSLKTIAVELTPDGKSRNQIISLLKEKEQKQ